MSKNTKTMSKNTKNIKNIKTIAAVVADDNTAVDNTVSKYGSEQVINILTSLQQELPELTNEIVENVLNKCVVECGSSTVFLEKWKKSLRSIKKAKKLAKKAARDPNAPKCPISSYIRFTMSGVRAQIKKEHPKYTPNEIVTEMGLRWKALSELERKPFVEQFDIEHADFMERKRVYELEHPSEKKTKRVKVEEEPVEFTEKDQEYFNKFKGKFSYFPFNEVVEEDDEKKEMTKQKRALTVYINNKYAENPEKLENMKKLVKRCGKIVLSD